MTVGGVILPETAKERPLLGTVVSLGPGKWDKENPGQRKSMIVSVGLQALEVNVKLRDDREYGAAGS